MSAPVITIDGPSGSGKGTLCQMLARAAGWHLLDSGALYRVTGMAARRASVDLDDGAALAELVRDMDVRFVLNAPGEPASVMLENVDISADLRTETAGADASRVAVHTQLREALLQRQRDFAQMPGLVADGRDMGTVVFPSAACKIFLTASAEERAERRYKQLKNKGLDVTLAALFEAIQDHDRRDSERTVAPLKPAADAIVVDSTGLSIETVYARVLSEAQKRVPTLNGIEH